ncbi:MAG: DUF2520 domain-containing protein [Legionellales bacterium]|nr:DUF2520 domain-containing protein [Legionellales bacterium]
MKPTFCIIGAGRLGKTLGRLIVSKKLGTLLGIHNQTLESANRAIEFIGEGQAYQSISTLPSCNIIFITTNDDAIEACVTQLASSKQLAPNTIVLHCSGSLSSTILTPLKTQSVFIASAHPIRSVADPQRSMLNYEGTFCALEGDEQALMRLTDLFTAFGSIPFRISAATKHLYHAGTVFASNYLVTLFNTSLTCLVNAGIESSVAQRIVLNLMQGTLQNLAAAKHPHEALTGPLMRGDIETIKAHLAALSPSLKHFYQALGLITLEMTALNSEQKEKLLAYFAEPNS